MKTITIIGTGYVGLVTGCCLAEMGNQVTCVDIDQEKIDSLVSGHLPFYEPGLEELFQRVTDSKRLSFTSDYSEAVPGADLCFLALPTPTGADESCDISFVLNAAKQLAEVMDNSLIIVNKSTVPIGTATLVGEAVRKTLDERGVEIPFDVISNPEFLREGSAVSDCMNPDRVILGGENARALNVLRDLYAPLTPDPNKILIMNAPTAELTKYAANAMLATRISFMNYLAAICEKTGAEIGVIKRALGADDRIGPHYLDAGIGFGGSCLPKDLQALRSMAAQIGEPTHLIDSILMINEERKESFFQKIESYFGDLSGRTFALWGLAFKPDTDDLRKAPSLYLINRLLEMGATIRAYDPVAMPKAKILLNASDSVTFCDDEYAATVGADAILLVTEWKPFRLVDFEKIKAGMHSPVIFDGRNLYDPEEMQRLGFDYHPIGRPSLKTPIAK